MRDLTIAGVGCYADLGQIVAEAVLSPPTKKSIVETVPYMSGFYDFSYLDGDAAYEDRAFEVRFEVVGRTAEELESKVSALLDWAARARNSEIDDSASPGWHLIGSFDGGKRKRVGGRIDELSLEFTCQPFRYANDETEAALEIGEHVLANPGQRVVLTGTSEGACILTVGNVSQTFTGTDIELEIALEQGENIVKVESSPCTLRWREARI